MQVKKIIGILLAVCFLVSVTAAAVSAAPNAKPFVKQPVVKSVPHNMWFQKTQAVNDIFKLSFRDNRGNVLRNDKGKELKVINVWGAKGKVFMKKNGVFTYTPYRSKNKIIFDSFKYAIKGKDKRISIATVKIIYENKKSPFYH